MIRFVYAVIITVLLALVLAPLALADDTVTPHDARNLAAWTAISAALLPWVAAIILRHNWSSAVKAVGVGVLSLVDAVLVIGFTSGWESFTFQNVVVTTAAVFAVARVTYAGLYVHFAKDPSDPDASNAIEKLEKATG